MKLKKCKYCKTYTLKENCSKCGKPTIDAHYKFIKIKNVSKKPFLKISNKKKAP